MKVKISQVLAELKLVMPGLSVKELIEQSGSFIYQDGMVSTFNDEIAVRHPSCLDFTGAVKSTEFQKLLSKTRTQEADITVNGNMLEIKAGKAKAAIVMEADINLPIGEVTSPSQWKKMSKELLEGIRLCQFSVGTDLAKPVLTCIHISGDYVQSSDNFRLTRYKMKKTKIKGSILLPSQAAKYLKEYNPTHYAVTEGWMHFKTEHDVIFSCRTFEGDFPVPSSMYDVKGTTVELPDGLKETMDLAGIFSANDATAPYVNVKLTKGRMKISSENDSGWYTESVRVDYKGKDLEFGVSPEFFIQLISLTDKVIVGDSMIKFSDDSMEHVVGIIA